MKIETVSIDLLHVDGHNPNNMMPEKFEALKENIKRYGFIVPVITNADYMIADGEHRFRAAQELNMSEIPVVKLDIQEVDRKILRQVLNKLKGNHSLVLDKLEYQKIAELQGLEDLSKLMGTDIAEFQQYIDELDDIPTDLEINDFNSDEDFKLTFKYESEFDYEKIINVLRDLNSADLNNALLLLVNNYEDNSKQEI
ncbi:MAG: ParB/RepB/Spo0J family partition protein [Flavobacteriaceae bacterium]